MTCRKKLFNYVKQKPENKIFIYSTGTNSMFKINIQIVLTDVIMT